MILDYGFQNAMKQGASHISMRDFSEYKESCVMVVPAHCRTAVQRGWLVEVTRAVHVVLSEVANCKPKHLLPDCKMLITLGSTAQTLGY